VTSSKAPFSKRRRKGWCEFSSRIPYLHPVLRIRFSYFYNFHSSSGVSLKQQLPCAVLICKSQHLNHGHVQPAFKFQLARLYFLLFLKDNDKSNDAFKINLVTFSRQSSLSRNLLEQSSASLLKLLDLGGQLPRYLGNPTWRERRRVPLLSCQDTYSGSFAPVSSLVFMRFPPRLGIAIEISFSSHIVIRVRRKFLPGNRSNWTKKGTEKSSSFLRTSHSLAQAWLPFLLERVNTRFQMTR